MTDHDHLAPEPIEEQATDDIGAVQGTDPAEAEADEPRSAQRTGGDTPPAPAPDAGEIEWAGGAIKRPPAPGA